MSEIITDKNKLEQSLHKLAQEKNDTKKAVPKEDYQRDVMTMAEIDRLLCYLMVASEPIVKKDSIITRIVNKITSLIPKSKQSKDDSIKFVISDVGSIHEDAYSIVLKKHKNNAYELLTQDEIDELIHQLIKVSKRLDKGKRK